MSLKSYLQGVHHIGITVESMERSFEFYTEVLGGTPIVTGNGFKGPEIHNALLEKEELENFSIPNLREGQDELDVRFIQFDNVVIELLQYHTARKDGQDFTTFPAHQANSSPAVVNNMHVSFYLKDDVDGEQFANELETRARERGFEQVRCNRVVKRQGEESKVFVVDAPGNDFDGWELIYVKGPSGEQLEFNRVVKRAKEVFGGAFERRKEGN